MENDLVHTSLPVLGYGAITNIAETGPGLPRTLERLTHIDYYMYDMITVVQGGPEQQRQVFDGTVRSLKWLFSYLPGKTKDSVSVNKLKAGEGDWNHVKEFLWWTINIEDRRVPPPLSKTSRADPDARHPGHATPYCP